jgi:hypothetical protein
MTGPIAHRSQDLRDDSRVTERYGKTLSIDWVIPTGRVADEHDTLRKGFILPRVFIGIGRNSSVNLSQDRRQNSASNRLVGPVEIEPTTEGL